MKLLDLLNAGTLLFLSTCVGWTQQASVERTGFEKQLEEQWEGKVVPFLKVHCQECHGVETSESDIDLSKFKDLDSVRSQPALWDQIRGVVRIGAMPPPESKQPTFDEREMLSTWVENALHRADCNIPQPPGHVTIRRLNNAEYDASIRQIFGLDLFPSQRIGFVSDEVGNGFDNQGEVLSMPPLLLEKYFQAGELIANTAIVSDRESLRRQSKDGDPLFEKERCSADYLFAEGEYEISIRMRFGDGQNDSIQAKVFVDGTSAQELEVGPKSKNYDFPLTLKEGVHRIEVEFTKDPESPDRRKFERRLHVERIRMEGPKEGLPAYPDSHRRILRVEPSSSKSVEDAARENFDSLLRMVFRRPPSRSEVDRIVDVVRKASATGMSFPEAMKIGIQASLVSPQFLYRIENKGGREVRPGVREVDSWDLASRISYFLWSSPPDEELLRAAESGELRDPSKLHLQVERMLDDPRSRGLIDGFFSQWLGLRNLSTIEVNAEQFPKWTDRLRSSMMKETQLFCEHLLGKEGKLLDILEADFTFINPRLAEFYGLEYEGKDAKSLYLGLQGRSRRSEDPRRPGAYTDEERFVKVRLPEQRRGLLTQAAILTLTSNPSRTSPVKRGKWVLENIIGDPPPPAPPNVPSFEETQKEHQNVSLRKQLEIHRSNPSCASCHRVLDPIGLGLENFNAVGEFREVDNGNPIEANGELADGRAFSGAVELLEKLQSDKLKIARHFARKMLTFALGRGLVTPDECAIDEILKRCASDDYRVRTFVHAVIESQPFQFHSSVP